MQGDTVAIKCEICGRPPKTRSLHHDHCHRCGQWRGWLCMRCNRGLYGELPALMRVAADYFERHYVECVPTKKVRRMQRV
jgi:Recombination endonuclease VII